MLDEPKEHAAPPDDTAVTHDGGQSSPAIPTEAPVTPPNEAYASTSNPYGHIETIPPEAKGEEITGYLTPEAVAQIPPKPPPPPPPADDEDEGNDEEKGMLRMSFMEHLEELRGRLLRAIGGLIVAFILSIGFCKDLWRVVSAPAVTALTHLGINPPNLASITPMEQFKRHLPQAAAACIGIRRLTMDLLSSLGFYFARIV